MWQDCCKVVFPQFPGGKFELNRLYCVFDKVTISVITFCFFRPFPSLLPPLFLPLACLFSVDADNVAAGPLTLANDGGRFMWKVPLRTVSIRSLNWRILSLT